MTITLRQLKYFDAVAECGSFSEAAERVHISQPALSARVKELEESLGIKLVERTSHGVILTPMGREVRTQVLRVLDEMLVLQTMERQDESGAFRVVVGIISTLGPYLLPALIRTMRNDHPQMTVDMVEAPGEQLVQRLVAGRLDAAILSVPLGILELAERELFEDRLVLAARAERLRAFRSLSSATAGGAEIAQSDLGPLLALAEGHCLGEQVLGACAVWRPQEARRQVDTLATLATLVADGDGWTLWPETAVAREREACPEISFQRLSAPEPSRRIGLVHRAVFEGQAWTGWLAEGAAEAGKALIESARVHIDEASGAETLGETA